MLKDLNLTGKYRLYLLPLFLIAVAFSCSNVQERSKPENVIPKEKMIDIYTDMILLDAMHRSNPNTLKSYGLKVSEHLYNKFSIDSTTLAQNIAYYNFEFETNIEIYEKVSERIEKKKENIDSIVKLRDSLEKEERLRKIELETSKDSTEVKQKKFKIQAVK